MEAPHSRLWWYMLTYLAGAKHFGLLPAHSGNLNSSSINLITWRTVSRLDFSSPSCYILGMIVFVNYLLSNVKFCIAWVLKCGHWGKKYLHIRNPHEIMDVAGILEIIKSNALIVKFKKLKPRGVICLSVKGQIINILSFAHHWSSLPLSLDLPKRMAKGNSSNKKRNNKKKRKFQASERKNSGKSRIMGIYNRISLSPCMCFINYIWLLNQKLQYHPTFKKVIFLSRKEKGI